MHGTLEAARCSSCSSWLSCRAAGRAPPPQQPRRPQLLQPRGGRVHAQSLHSWGRAQLAGLQSYIWHSNIGILTASQLLKSRGAGACSNELSVSLSVLFSESPNSGGGLAPPAIHYLQRCHKFTERHRKIEISSWHPWRCSLWNFEIGSKKKERNYIERLRERCMDCFDYCLL